jgi:peptidyl-prolyl cis-trans isomerase A (cyclophilin A)
VRVHRDWAPHGADRFYSLVQARFFDGVAFFRVIRGFVAQFGLHGTPAVAQVWEKRSIPDDSTRASNTRGTLSFANDGPSSRSTQMFFNLGDNSRLDHFAPAGFPPIGKVTDGLPVLDALESKYSSAAGRELPGPNQDTILAQGDAYLKREFPDLDRIKTARVVRVWKD